MTAVAMVFVACTCGALSGGIGCWTAGQVWGRRKNRHLLLDRSVAGLRTGDECYSGGIARYCIIQAKQASRQSVLSLPGWAYVGIAKLTAIATPAGLRFSVNREGLAATRLKMALFACATASLVGAIFSLPCALLAGLAGFAWGWTSIRRALVQEQNVRRTSLERHLSQAIEVICLGLRSGLSFDRTLLLYCSCFDTAFAHQLEVASAEWSSGLRTREEALRAVQESYDSRLLQRTIDGIVRSLRFGSPLADTLDALAAEARLAHKAEIEEQVAKAPVKMMVPVGTLILPSMLLLVMGPVLVDLLL